MLRRQFFALATLLPFGKARANGTPAPREIWEQMVRELVAVPRGDRLRRANDAINQWMAYKADEEDYWQTPFESLARRTGDCEDYAIAKYALLRCSELPAGDVRLGYGRTTALGGSIAHVVTLVREPTTQWHVLDNLRSEVSPLLQGSDFELQFAFSEGLVWAAQGEVLTPKRARVRQFDLLYPRMHDEGSLPPTTV